MAGGDPLQTLFFERAGLTRSKFRLVAAGLLALVLLGLWLPADTRIPVDGARPYDWNDETFWYDNWGDSGVHKGIDIFGDRGTDVFAPASGLVVYTGNISRGGNVVIILGARWRAHYLAHFDRIDVGLFDAVGHDDRIGALGTTGNARGKQPHVHYSIFSLVPYPWLMTNETQGWKKMFYLDPDAILTGQ